MLSRNQESLLAYRSAASSMQASLFPNEEEAFVEGFEYFALAVEDFGHSELKYREAERQRVLGESACSEEVAEAADALNRRGLERLAEARERFAELMEQSSSEAEEGDEDSLQAFTGDLKGFFAELEIKPADVEKLAERVDEVAEAVRGGEMSVYDYVLSRIDELDEARRSDDRGLRSNISKWCIIAIAAYLGLSALKVWLCFARRRGCGKLAKAAFEVGKTILSIVLKFCK